MNFVKLLVAVIVGTSFVFAQVEGSKAEEKTETKTQEKAEQKAALKTIYGKIVSVDAIANTIIIKTKKAEDTLSVEPGAKIMIGKNEITLGDLKTDAQVTVTWKMVDSKKTVTKIIEKPVKKESRNIKTDSSMKGMKMAGDTASKASESGYWTCPMHLEINKTASGTCPMCGMNLIFKKSDKDTTVMRGMDQSKMKM